MPKKMYIGINNAANSMKKGYIGIDNVAKKITKGYIGIDNIAQQFYVNEILIPFTTCPTPTVWTNKGTYYLGSNSYGDWTIWYESSDTSRPHYAFDGDEDTKATLETETTMEIHFPDNIYINFSKIFIMHQYCKNGYISGYNIDTKQWEDLGDIETSSIIPTSTNITISNNSYYSKLKIYGESSRIAADPCIYEIQIKSGTIKQIG